MKQIFIEEAMNFNILLSNLSIKVITLSKSFPDSMWHVADHSHDFFEFHLIPSGKGRIVIEDREVIVNGGEFYITGPYVRHTQYSMSEDPMTEYTIKCHISILEDIPSGYSFTIDESRLIKKALSNCYPQVFKDNNGICAKFESIMAEQENKKIGYQLHTETLIVAIVIDILRATAYGTHSNPQSSKLQEDEIRISRFMEFLHGKYNEDIDIHDFSKVLFLSPRQINRFMQKHFGKPFGEFLVEFRVNKVVQLLQESDMSVEAISAAAGFSSLSYMYQVFKRLGMHTPAHIRTEGR